ncbi:MAG: metallophosphoesterase [Ruminococcus sp.]|nr:metallophosphoesterase [Ruminococcus sp.]
MKILLLSDTHGNLSGMQKALEKYGKNADFVVHCGDGTRGEAKWLKKNVSGAKVICVRGNCDFSSELNEIEFFDVYSKRIMVTHGHCFGVKYGLENLSYKAEEKGADIVFFGHTHICTDETLGGIRLINPGSCGRWEATCAVIEIDERGNVLVNHVRVK